MLDMERLQRWLDGYVSAWRSGDPQEIGELFSEDAVYRHDPFEDAPLRGREAIVASWVEEPDDVEAFECAYEALAVTGDVGIGEGWTRYRATAEEPERAYRNLFVMRFDEAGRCRDFTEWYMQPKESRSTEEG